MIWSKIQNNALFIGVFLGGVGLGALSQSALDKSPKLPWLHQQAAILHQVQTNEIPKLADAAGCQTKRARIAESLLNKSENGKDVDESILPDCPLAPKVGKK